MSLVEGFRVRRVFLCLGSVQSYELEHFRAKARGAKERT